MSTIRDALYELHDAVHEQFFGNDTGLPPRLIKACNEAGQLLCRTAQPEGEVEVEDGERLRSLFDATRYQMADALGVDRGHGWTSLAMEIGRLKASCTPQPPADGEVAELVERLKSVKQNDNSISSSVHWGLSDGTIHHHRIHVTSNHASDCDRAAELLQRQHPQPVPVSERLPQLRRQFEATLNEARCFTKRYVGNSELADRLIGDVLAANAGPGRIELLPDGTQIIEPAEHTLLVPVLQPVPVAERLPGPEDLDVEGTCWVWNFTAYTWGLFRLDLTAHSHWLPAHALPVPTSEGDHAP